LSRLRPRFSLGHKLYAVALLLTVMAIILAVAAYLPLTKTNGQVEAAQKDIARSMAVERLGRGVADWLWQASSLVLNGPDGDRNRLAVAHVVSTQALRTLEESELSAQDFERVEVTRSAMNVMNRWVEQIELAVERGDRPLAIQLLAFPGYMAAGERLGLPLDGFIRREHNQMRAAIVRLAGDAAEAGPIANGRLNKHVLEVRSDIETSIYASGFVRSQLLHGQLMAAVLAGNTTFDSDLLRVLRTLASTDFQNWQEFAAESTSEAHENIAADMKVISNDQAKINAVGESVEGLIAKEELDSARGLFKEEFAPLLNDQVTAAQTLINEYAEHVSQTSEVIVHDARRMSLLVAGFAAIVLGLAFASARTARRTAKRITRTTKDVRGISRDDLATRVEVTGNDELSQLAEAFNDRMDDLAEAREAERGFLKQTVDTAEAERMRLAAELHDGPIQRLTGLLYRVELLGTRISRGESDQLPGLVNETQTKLSAEISTLRNMLSELRPPVLDERGLGPALQDYISDFSRREGINCELDVQVDGRVAESLETTMYRVAQEALSNVGKHSEANNVNLALRADNGSIHLLVADDGVGFDTDEIRDGSGGMQFGVTSMRERVRMAGGRFELASVRGAGTTVRATFPRLMREAA
jgi:signal transduction histidine kinase